MLHTLVAHFLRVRFPILLALNKVDVNSASPNIVKFKAQSSEPAVPVSARCEWALCQLRRQGLVSYSHGSNVVHFSDAQRVLCKALHPEKSAKVLKIVEVTLFYLQCVVANCIPK